MKDKSKKYETVWICDFCGEEFSSELKAGNHEEICSKNPKNKNNSSIYLWVILIGIIAFIYLVITFDTNKTPTVTYTKDSYSDLEEKIEEYRDALEEANDRIEEAKYYTWESYEDMGYALENLDTVSEP